MTVSPTPRAGLPSAPSKPLFMTPLHCRPSLPVSSRSSELQSHSYSRPHHDLCQHPARVSSQLTHLNSTLCTLSAMNCIFYANHLHLCLLRVLPFSSFEPPSRSFSSSSSSSRIDSSPLEASQPKASPHSHSILLLRICSKSNAIHFQIGATRRLLAALPLLPATPGKSSMQEGGHR